jgi:hypothetical protein
MRRDLDVIRNILKEIEKLEVGKKYFIPQSDDSEFQNYAYHLKLLIDSEMVKGTANKSNQNGKYSIAFGEELTLDGHDLLDQIRDEKVWKRVKEKFENREVKISIALINRVSLETIIENM